MTASIASIAARETAEAVAGLEARVEKLRRALLTIERSCRNPRARGVAAHDASQVAGNAIVADNAAKEAPRG